MNLSNTPIQNDQRSPVNVTPTSLIFVLGLPLILAFGYLIGKDLSILNLEINALILIFVVLFPAALLCIRRAEIFLFGTVLLILIGPTMRITFASIPLYLFDIMLVYVIAGRLLIRDFPKIEWDTLPVKLLLFWVVSWIPSTIHGAVISNSWLEQIYMFGRNGLGVLLFLFVIAYAQKLNFLKQMVRVLMIGVIVTSLVGILQVFPAQAIREPISRLVELLYFGNASISSARLANTVSGTYSRAWGAYLAATTLGGVLATYLFLFWGQAQTQTKRNRATWLWLGVSIVTAALLLTYTRHAFVGLIMAILLLMGLGHAGRMIRFLLIGLISVSILLSTSLIDEAVLVSRTSAFIEQGVEEPNLKARIDGHTRFARFVVNNPIFGLFGRGLGSEDVWARAASGTDDILNIGSGLPVSDLSELRSGFGSNSYLLWIYDVGPVGGLTYIGLIVLAINHAVTALNRAASRSELYWLTWALTASAITGAILHAFDNYYQTFMAIKLAYWVLLALLFAATQHLKAEQADLSHSG